VGKIAPHLHLIRSGISNVWLFQNPADGKRFLIDTGHSLERLPLLASLWRLGIRMPGDLAGILLTHRHSDHAGNAAWMRKQFGAPVFCHEHDARILRGEKPAPLLKRGTAPFFKEWLCGMEDERPAFVEVDDVFSDGLWKWGLRITSVPGHTEGSVMIHHEGTATLFSGDSILVGSPLNRRSKKLRMADPHFSDEPETAQRSIRRYLQALPPTEILCSGHGPVVDEQAFMRLKKLLLSPNDEQAR
jgi:glyoxylase-like metal-dependent hydrolase (beta-lactamase superfamily II)